MFMSGCFPVPICWNSGGRSRRGPSLFDCLNARAIAPGVHPETATFARICSCRPVLRCRSFDFAQDDIQRIWRFQDGLELGGRRHQQTLESRGCAPRFATSVLAKAVGYPRYVVGADDEVRPRPPETRDVVGAEQLTGLADAYHGTRTLGTQLTSASQSAKTTRLSRGDHTGHIGT